MKKTRKAISMYTTDEVYEKVTAMAEEECRSVANFIMKLVLDEWNRRHPNEEYNGF